MERTRPRYTDLPFDRKPGWEQVSEIFYKHALDLAKCGYHAVNRAYPMAEQKVPRVKYRYEEAHSLVKKQLNFYKKTVFDFLADAVIAKRHSAPYDASQDVPTKELRSLLEAQMTMLHRRLHTYADITVPKEDLESYIASLDKLFPDVIEGLRADLAPYEATPKLKPTDLE